MREGAALAAAGTVAAITLAAIALLLPALPPGEAVLGLLAIACLIVVLLKPVIGVYALVAVVIVFPSDSLTYGLFRILDVQLYVTDVFFYAIMLGWLVRVLAGKWSIPKASFNLPLVVFLGFVAFMVVYSLPGNPRWQSVLTDARLPMYYALYFPMLTMFRDFRQVTRLLVWMALVLGGMALFGLYGTAVGLDAYEVQTYAGSFRRVYQAYGTGFFVAAIPFLAIGLQHYTGPWTRRALLLAAAASVLLLVVQLTRGDWLGFAAGTVFLLVFLPRRDRNRVLSGFGLGALLIVVIALVSEFYELPSIRILQAAGELTMSMIDPWRADPVAAMSGMGRLSEWQVAFTLIERQPILGYGFGSWIPVWGPGLEWLEGQVFQLHSSYANFLVKAGVLGLLLFWAICLAFIRRAILISRQARDDAVSSLVICMAAGFVSAIFASFTAGFILRSEAVVPWVAIIMALTMSIEVLEKQRGLVKAGQPPPAAAGGAEAGSGKVATMAVMPGDGRPGRGAP